MDKRILLPTDFSKNALNAIRYALELYKNETCDFYFLNAYQVNGYSIDSMMVPEPGEMAYEAAKKASEDGFTKLMAILKLNSQPNHTYHTVSTFNSLLYAIKNMIAINDIDLIIMGTKGATGSDAVIFGTNTVNIMENITECPVLAIPEDFKFSPPNEIAFPTDYKTPFKRRELNNLLEIAKMHNTSIKVLHVKQAPKLSTVQQSNKVLLESILKGHNYSHHELTDIKVKKGILSFIQSRDVDMVAFMNKKHHFFGSILAKPLVKEIGYDAEIPILELNDN
ncbi:universal stress protein [Spongiimicrobium sp. 3-5]|uniref:universal stress protein n=1 Tax=Spongiimicrobium sp. 3-5 TaxID=3332596 RepID=UPI00398094E7